jgi:hypothetical protein
MMIQKWIECSEKLPGDRWGGKIRIRYPNGKTVEKQCLGFMNGEFTYQDGIADGKAGRMIWENGGPGEVIAWLGFVEEDLT